MPCRDEGAREYYDAITIREQKARLDTVTRLLCETLTALEKEDKGLRIVSDECERWWREHREADRQRKEADAERERAKELARLKAIADLETKLAELKAGK